MDRYAEELFRSIIILILISIMIIGLLKLISMFLNFQLKKTMLQKGVSGSFLEDLSPKKNDLSTTVKWIAILASVGIGLIIVHFTQPFDIHSLAIMSLSLAAGFTGYYLWAKKNT